MAKSMFDEVVQLQNDMDPLIKKFEKLSSQNNAFLSTELKRLKGYQSFMEKVNTNLAKAIKSRSTAEARSLKEVAERVANNHRATMDLLKKREQAELDYLNAVSDEDQALHKHRMDNYSEQLAEIDKIDKSEKRNAQNLIDGLVKYQRAIDDMNSRVKGSIFDPQVGFFGSGAKLKDMDKNIEFMETRLTGAADAVGDAFSGNLDTVQSRIDKLGRGSGKFLKDLSTSAKMKMKGKEGGGGGGMALKLMSKLGGVGTLLTGLTAGLGALFAVFKVMQAIEEKIKAVNSELLDTYGASDLLASGMTNVYDSVNQIRKELSDPNFANGLGVTLDEARKLAYTFNDIGVNFGSLQDDGLSLTDSITKLKDMTTVFQASAKTLGVDFSTLVGFSKEFSQELGVSVKEGKYLERMSEEFGRIRDLAKQSSLNTKDFFGVIQDLSQGIGTMNIRIGEAANLFVNLQKVLGPQAAQAFVKGLAGGFKGEGIQDRFKRIILTGGMKKVMKRSAEDTKKEFFKNFGGTKVDKLLKEVGVDRSTDFSKISDSRLEQIMGHLRRLGGQQGQGAARDLMRNVRLARGGKGGLNAQALALGDLDMTGALSAQMKQLYSVTGGKGFRDVTAIEMEKIAQMTGKSIEELEGLRLLDMQSRDDFRVLQEIQKNNVDEGGFADAEAMKIALEKAGFKDFKVDEKGNIVDKSGRAIKDIQDYIASQGAVIDAKQTVDAQLDQVTLLQEVVEATMTSADMINNHLGGLLQSLNDPVNAIAGRFVYGDRQKKLEKARALRDEVKADSSQLQKDEAKERKRAGAERLRIDKIKNKKEREKAEEEEKRRKKKAEDDFKKRRLKIDIKSKQATLNAQNRKFAEGDEDGYSAAVAEVAKKGVDEQKRVEKNLGTGKALEAYLKSQGLTMDQLMTVARGEELDEHMEMFGRDPDDVANEKKVRALMEKFGIKSIADVKNIKKLGTTDQITEQQVVQTKAGGIATLTHDRTTAGMSGKATEFRHDIRSGVSQMRYGEGEVTQLDDKARASLDKQVQGVTQLNSEIAATKEEIKNLGETPEDIKKRAELTAKIQAKNSELRKMNIDTAKQAILEARKEELSNIVKNKFQGDGDLSSASGRKSYIDKIDAKIEEIYSKDTLTKRDEREAERLMGLREDFRMYYAQDASLSPGGGTPFIGNAGSLIRGTDTDTAMLVDFTKAGTGGGGQRGNVIFNVNGNNEQAMLSFLEHNLRSLGLIS